MTSPRHERLLRDLTELKLHRIAEMYQEVLNEAARKGSSMLEVLALLIGEEADCRRQRALERRIHPRPAAQAKNPRRVQLLVPQEDFPSRPSCGCSTATSSPSTAAPCSSERRELESRIS